MTQEICIGGWILVADHIDNSNSAIFFYKTFNCMFCYLHFMASYSPILIPPTSKSISLRIANAKCLKTKPLQLAYSSFTAL